MASPNIPNGLQIHASGCVTNDGVTAAFASQVGFASAERISEGHVELTLENEIDGLDASILAQPISNPLTPHAVRFIMLLGPLDGIIKRFTLSLHDKIGSEIDDSFFITVLRVSV